ncbi:hypothetical protein AB6A40_003374 [Gnathostoma spinigerum]|uniref:Uncharacterized protein n=1 Tax=Gnathostoma spinigerum TaxID=75299 RepID=A0ABD6EK72_9BILA
MLKLPIILLAVSFAESFRMQSVGVKGRLRCGANPIEGAKVKLWDVDTTEGPDKDDLLEAGETDENGFFELSGHTEELSTIDPALRIYHDCDDGIMPCQREVQLIIPDSYVTEGEKAGRIFDIGELNLQVIFPCEDRNCLGQRRRRR